MKFILKKIKGFNVFFKEAMKQKMAGMKGKKVYKRYKKIFWKLIKL